MQRNYKNVMINPLTGEIELNYYPNPHKKDDKDEEELQRVWKLNPKFCPIPSQLTLDQKFKLALSIGVDCIEEDELMNLLKSDKHFICYDGFEPSGRMHIAQGVMKMINVNKIVDCGGIFVFWIADWFGLLNNKMWDTVDSYIL